MRAKLRCCNTTVITKIANVPYDVGSFSTLRSNRNVYSKNQTLLSRTMAFINKDHLSAQCADNLLVSGLETSIIKSARIKNPITSDSDGIKRRSPPNA